MAWLQSIEGSSWAIWIKESPSLAGYTTLLFLHTVGLSFTVGPSVAIDMRVLGVGRRIPLPPFDAFFKVIWIAFAFNAVSGAVLFFSDATAKLENPAYLVKMALVFIAAAITIALRRRVFRSAAVDAAPVDASSRFLAAASILCWFGAITAGRYIAYF